MFVSKLLKFKVSAPKKLTADFSERYFKVMNSKDWTDQLFQGVSDVFDPEIIDTWYQRQ